MGVSDGFYIKGTAANIETFFPVGGALPHGFRPDVRKE
jgi:hypothetical protein